MVQAKIALACEMLNWKTTVELNKGIPQLNWEFERLDTMQHDIDNKCEHSAPGE